MTAAEQQALTPLLDALQARGIVSRWDSDFLGEANDDLVLAFRIMAPGLSSSLLITRPFTEGELITRLAATIAHQRYADAIDHAFQPAKDSLLRDLAAVIEGRLRGKALPMPERVTIRSIDVELGNPDADTATAP